MEWVSNRHKTTANNHRYVMRGTIKHWHMGRIETGNAQVKL